MCSTHAIYIWSEKVLCLKVRIFRYFVNAAEDGNSAEQQFPFLFSPPFTPICGWHFSLFYSKLPYSDTCMSSQKKSNIASPRDHSWFHPNIGKTNDGPADSICGSDVPSFSQEDKRSVLYLWLSDAYCGWCWCPSLCPPAGTCGSACLACQLPTESVCANKSWAGTSCTGLPPRARPKEEQTCATTVADQGLFTGEPIQKSWKSKFQMTLPIFH